jgi:hypothetical protein
MPGQAAGSRDAGYLIIDTAVAAWVLARFQIVDKRRIGETTGLFHVDSGYAWWLSRAQ